ncbi:MFS transporter [Cohnella zeiphila]|uniref:MFS transporter n=1 Tax=Cohnella zeiphila TaxID=2761120 RepID=A0A7X0SVG1_9BACL|nr:MFS transporter [Cohnella zeiphila]MBB6734613.1 MFS transporter [Cohnella zeiphila]
MEKTWFKESKRAWIGLGSLWIVGFIGALMRFIMAFFQVQISEDLGISRGFISMAWSTNLLIAALCAPLGGWLADRYGAKNVLLFSAAMGTIGTGIVAFGHHDLLFFIGYGVICGIAGIGTTANYLLILGWFRHHRAKATGLLASASSLGLAISTPVFVSASWLTWKDAFLASFALSLIVTLPAIGFGIKGTKPPRQAAAPASERPAAHAAPRGIALQLPVLIVIAGALFTCGFNMGTVEMNLVAIHQLANVPPRIIALSMSVLGIMEITGSLVVGYLMDKIDKRIILTALYGIRIAGFSLLYGHLGWSPELFAFAFGITYLSAVPGGVLLASEYSQGKGKQTGWLLLFHQGGGILGSLAGGLSFDYFRDYQVLIGADVLLCVLAAIGYLLLYTTRNQKRKASYTFESNAG